MPGRRSGRPYVGRGSSKPQRETPSHFRHYSSIRLHPGIDLDAPERDRPIDYDRRQVGGDADSSPRVNSRPIDRVEVRRVVRKPLRRRRSFARRNARRRTPVVEPESLRGSHRSAFGCSYHAPHMGDHSVARAHRRMRVRPHLRGLTMISWLRRRNPSPPPPSTQTPGYGSWGPSCSAAVRGRSAPPRSIGTGGYREPAESRFGSGAHPYW